MHIEIAIPRPGLTALLLIAISGWTVALGGWKIVPTQASVDSQVSVEQASVSSVAPGDVSAHTHDVVSDDAVIPEKSPAQGGDDTPAALERAKAEERARQAREEQQMIAHKEEILRFQLEELAKERQALGTKVDEDLESQFDTSARLFTSLLKDERRAEQFLLTSLNQIWEAEGRATSVAGTLSGKSTVLSLLWPVEPMQGISAYFHDKAYEERFKLVHNAIDIPTPQGTNVEAAAGGVVAFAVDHGLGFNYVTIQHPGGYSTLYGHLEKINVQQGQTIIAGDVIGKSGGRPGTPGAGFSTGPHLHFGVFVNGAAVNPMNYLPQRSGVGESQE